MKANDYMIPHERLTSHNGITIRDYIAIEAMQALINEYHKNYLLNDMPKCAYAIADAMIKESEK